MEEISSPSTTEEDEEQPSKVGRTRHKQDSRWSILVCACAFLTQILSSGPFWGFGVLFPSMLVHFNTDKASAAAVSSVFTATHFTFGPIVGKLCSRYQCRIVNICGLLLFSLGYILTSFAQRIEVMYFTYGVIGGFASCLILLSSLSIVADYFSKYRTSASATAMSGAMVGYFIVAGVGQRLEKSIGLMNVYRLYSGAAFFPVLINSWAFDPNVELSYTLTEEEKQKSASQKTSCKNFIDLSMMKNRSYAFLVMSMTFYFWSLLVIGTHIGRHCLDIGIAEENIFRLFMTMAGANLAGRLLIGKLGDFKQVDKLRVIQFITIAMGILTAVLPNLHTLLHLTLCVAIISFGEGGVQSFIPLVIFGIMGQWKYPQAFGLFLFITTPFISSGSYITGLIADKTGNYSLSFYITGSCFMIAGISNILFMMFGIKKNMALGEVELLVIQEENYMIVEKETVL